MIKAGAACLGGLGLPKPPTENKAVVSSKWSVLYRLPSTDRGILPAPEPPSQGDLAYHSSQETGPIRVSVAFRTTGEAGVDQRPLHTRSGKGKIR